MKYQIVLPIRNLLDAIIMAITDFRHKFHNRVVLFPSGSNHTSSTGIVVCELKIFPDEIESLFLKLSFVLSNLF